VARVRIAGTIYAVALLLLPFSAAVKQIFDLNGFVWIAPSLILGIVVFVLLDAPILDKRVVYLALFAMLSGLLGSFFLPASRLREHSSLYSIYAEPIRLVLDLVWYSVSIWFFVNRRDSALRWLTISAFLQLTVAAYLYLALFELVPVPETVATYLLMYRARQVLFWGNSPVYRMAGTFIEGPPFGLFMFSCLVICALGFYVDCTSLPKKPRRWTLLGILVGTIGSLLSLSDGVLLSLSILGIGFYLHTRSRWVHRPLARIIEVVALLVFCVTVGTYTIQRLREKWELAKAPTPINNDVLGDSGAERAFHVQYGLARFGEVPLALISGIGPGRYGDYATRTGMFPPSVDIAFMPAAWLIEFGVCGSAIIVVWLWRIGSRSKRAFGRIGTCSLVALLIANTGQANWLWETWFLALAFLYASGSNRGPRQVVSSHPF